LSNLIHVWSRCHACGAQPIVGRRFECTNCPAGPDNDLCEPCYREYERGRVEHPARESYAKLSGRVGQHSFRARDGVFPGRFESWLTVPWTGANFPTVPDRFVVRPEFRVGRESFFGPYAFVVDAEDGDQPLVLTALHVMDELIKHIGLDCTAQNLTYTGEELPGAVTEVGLYDVFAPNWMAAELGSAGSMLVLPEARVGEEEPISDRDVAAFRAFQSARVRAGRLAMETPHPGEPVWLAVRTPSSSSRTIPAVVVEATDRTFIIRFANSQEVAPHSSGAPLLDRDGAVVGINVGAGWFGGQRFGHANHQRSIRRHLGMTNTSASHLR